MQRGDRATAPAVDFCDSLRHLLYLGLGNEDFMNTSFVDFLDWLSCKVTSNIYTLNEVSVKAFTKCLSRELQSFTVYCPRVLVAKSKPLLAV